MIRLKKRTRFGSHIRKTVVDGIHFSSALEARVYQMLVQWEQEGKIINLQMQQKVGPEKCKTKGCNGYVIEKRRRSSRGMRPVKLDFRCLVNQDFDGLKNGDDLIVEAKGIVQQRWLAFVEWFKDNGPPGMVLREYRARGTGIALYQEIRR